MGFRKEHVDSCPAPLVGKLVEERVKGGGSSELDFGITAWIYILALLFTSCVVWGRSLTLSVLSSFNYKMGVVIAL